MLLLSGLFLLFSAVAALWLGRRLFAASGRHDAAFLFRYARLRLPGRVLRMLRRAVHLSETSPALDALRSQSLSLAEGLLRMQRALREVPPLPAGTDRKPRVMALAHDLAEEGAHTASALTQAIARQTEDGLTSRERLFLPQAISLAYAHRLEKMLRLLHEDAQDRQRAQAAAVTLARCRDPFERLTRRPMSGVFLAALIAALREKKQEALLAALDEWLALHDSSAADIQAKAVRRETHLCEELTDISAALAALPHMNWLEAAAGCDPLHELLLTDPAQVYPHMSAASCAKVRLAAEDLARKLHVSPRQAVHAALTLCEEAEEKSIEAHVGTFFLEPAGMEQVRRAIGTGHGRWAVFCLAHREGLIRAGLWVFAFAAGFLFVNARHPLLLAPVFALLAGCVSRTVLRRVHDEPPLPAMEVPAVTEELRTLVVLPAVLHDPHEAIALARYLKTARQAFPANGADCLLMADYAPAITQISRDDEAIRTAAIASIEALNGTSAGRFLYMQRSRQWDVRQRTYAARNGSCGAIETLCRLIAQGECEDMLEYASVEPAFFHRHYAFILTLTPESRPAPGMLEALLSAAAHPLCTRFPTPEGMRGSSIFRPRVFADPAYTGSTLRMLETLPSDGCFQGVGLIRPDAFLSDIDGVLPSAQQENWPLAGELAGVQAVPDAAVQQEAPTHVSSLLDHVYRRSFTAWQGVLWQLPWVQTPSGLLRDPLGSRGRFRLRETLRETVIPLAQSVMLLYAMLLHDLPLFLLVLLLPEVQDLLPLTRKGLSRLLCRTALLPLRTAARVLAAFDALMSLLPENKARPRRKELPWPAIEAWTQGVAGTVAIALGLAWPPLWLPSMLLGGLFGCFPLIHARLDGPIDPPAVLSREHEDLLADAARATWRFFRDEVTEQTHHLPPVAVQTDPPVPPDDATSPEAIAMYLCSCAAAKDLGLADTEEICDRIDRALRSLHQLSMPDGLPCRRYALSTLVIADPCVDAAACGLLAAALMTCAQAIRTWLPECPLRHHGLPAALDEFAGTLALRRLYDADAGLFTRGLDADGQGTSLCTEAADPSLMLSLTACARRAVPPMHMARLSATLVRAGSDWLPLSQRGDAAAYLLPGLFLPIAPETASACIRLQQLHGMEGLFGCADCAGWEFTPELRYRSVGPGLPEAALSPVHPLPVYAAYAAALALPHAPDAAARCLLAMRDRGMCGPHGYCEAIDLRLKGPHGEPAARLVGLHDSFHQGILLCAAAHVLADAPVQRYFCALPEVEAALPLLHLSRMDQLLLPGGFHPHMADAEEHAAFLRAAFPPACVPDAHLLGSTGVSLLTDANGSGCICLDGLPLTRFDRRRNVLSGLQCYVADEGRVFRVTDASLPGETVFSDGEARFERRCGSIKTTLTLTIDPARRWVMHLLTITNLSTVDRVIEAADCLLPDMHAPACTLEAAHPSPNCLTLRSRSTGHTLRHTLTCSAPPVLRSVCTDETAFLGRGRTLHAPASLEEPMHDAPAVSSTPCLSFRGQFSLGGRGQLTLLFTTGLSEEPAPSLSDMPGLSALAAMQARALAGAIPLTASQERAASLLTGPILWGNPDAPLAVTFDQEENLPLLADTLAVTAWFHLKSVSVTVCAVCPEGLHDAVRQLAAGLSLPEGCLRLLTRMPDGVRLILHEGGGSLEAQAHALYRPQPIPAPDAAPTAASLPREKVEHESGFGGFDADTKDYFVLLEPQQTTPVSWENAHCSALWHETADETGMIRPIREHVRLYQEGGAVIDPFAPALPRIMRQGAGYTAWRTYTDALDIEVTACCIPGFPAGMRALRVTNATEKAVTLTIRVAADLLRGTGAGPAVLPGIVAVPLPGRRVSACLAGMSEGWLAGTCSLTADSLGVLHPLPDEQGTDALLTCAIQLSPGGSAEAVWAAGYADHLEQIEEAGRLLREAGVSAALRQVRQAWAPRLSGVTVSTPEDTFDILMNRILPLQIRTGDAPLPDVIPALAVTEPEAARDLLLQCATRATRRAEWFLLALSAVQYARITGDDTVWDSPLPTGTLMDRCTDALLTLPLDHRGLPTAADPAPRAFMAAAAAKALHEVSGNEALSDLARKLRNAADAHLWTGTHYGEESVSLAAQAWAALAIGPDTRTKQALATAWTRLYDEEHGLLRQHLPDEQLAALSGTPRNGGQDTRTAVWAMQAMARLHQSENAWTLARALNPIHHTDDPLRTEEYCGSPWRLPGGMDASPAASGRASGDGTAAAGWLYITLLEDMLGFRRRGEKVHLAPCLPGEWDGYALTLQWGASTWHFSLERDMVGLTLDGTELSGHEVTLTDDGKVHQVRMARP